MDIKYLKRFDMSLSETMNGCMCARPAALSIFAEAASFR